MDRRSLAQVAHVRSGAVDIVEPEGDPEGEHRGALATLVGPESSDGIGALAECFGRRGGRVPALPVARDAPVRAFAGAADPDRGSRTLDRQRRGDQTVQVMATRVDLWLALRPHLPDELERLV